MGRFAGVGQGPAVELDIDVGGADVVTGIVLVVGVARDGDSQFVHAFLCVVDKTFGLVVDTYAYFGGKALYIYLDRVVFCEGVCCAEFEVAGGEDVDEGGFVGVGAAV